MKIASALKVELKDQNSRAKLVAVWVGANERTVKNWILGHTHPAAGTSWNWLSIQTRR
jgi:metallophosphoesterase superfamily enzyme